MPDLKPTHLLKTALSSIVLVVTAVGSVINLIKGFNLSIILLTLIIVAILLLVIAELRERKKAGGGDVETRRCVEAVPDARIELPAMPPVVASTPWYWNDRDQLVVRMNRVLPPRDAGSGAPS
jgi:hypothetical protein